MSTEFRDLEEKHNVVMGVGRDAEIEVNSKGGLQSKAIGAFYLIDPNFMVQTMEKPETIELMHLMARFMFKTGQFPDAEIVGELKLRIPDMLERIAKVMEFGRVEGNNGKGYPPNNWRKIPQEDHLNHALIHLYAYDRGDTSDNHLDHFLARVMMMVTTKPETIIKYTEPED